MLKREGNMLPCWILELEEIVKDDLLIVGSKVQ